LYSGGSWSILFSCMWYQKDNKECHNITPGYVLPNGTTSGTVKRHKRYNLAYSNNDIQMK